MSQLGDSRIGVYRSLYLSGVTELTGEENGLLFDGFKQIQNKHQLKALVIKIKFN